MGALTKAEKEQRKELDAEIKVLFDKGYECKEIAALLGLHVNKVSASIGRLTGFNWQRTTAFNAEREAELLIAAKMAPTVKPKAHKIMVNGWENGHYVHYEAYDVSEFWGLS